MNAKGFGGLIRREKRIKKDRRGNETIQHWDGRRDVTIKNPEVARLPRRGNR